MNLQAFLPTVRPWDFVATSAVYRNGLRGSKQSRAVSAGFIFYFLSSVVKKGGASKSCGARFIGCSYVTGKRLVVVLPFVYVSLSWLSDRSIRRMRLLLHYFLLLLYNSFFLHILINFKYFYVVVNWLPSSLLHAPPLFSTTIN